MGTVIASKYELLQKLGQGGMGSVWRAEHTTLRSQVAIKLIDPALATTGEAVSRFLREAQAAASLRSAHVVQILDHGVDDGVPYIAMELLEGESLGDRLTRLGRLEPAETARLLVQIGRAVSRAHDAGIVHRDLKPDNVFIVRNDDEEIAKVLDFGIAKLKSVGTEQPVDGMTRTGALLGTPYYMSPEQAEGHRSLDHRSDIWALGVIAYECLLGQRPFQAETIGSLILAICSHPLPRPSAHGDVPVELDAWFARACSRSASERFESAREACAELRRVCAGPLSSSVVNAGAAQLTSSEVVSSSAGDGVLGDAPQARSLLGLSSQRSLTRAAPGSRAVAMLALACAIAGGGAILWLRMRPVAEPPSASSAAVGSVLATASTSPPAPSAAMEAIPSASHAIPVESLPLAAAAAIPPANQAKRSAAKTAKSAAVAEPAPVVAPVQSAPPKQDPSPPPASLPENPYQRPAGKQGVNLGI